MSSLGTKPRYYREEFERPPGRLPRWAMAALLIALATFTHYAAFLAGAAMKAADCRQALAAANGARPACASLAPVHNPLTQWKCSWTEHREYHSACRERLVSELRIPPKEK